jgi:TRAP-type uncharacterized transport system fused permease subunit
VFFFYCCSKGTLRHLQKFLQYIKYTILGFSLSLIVCIVMVLSEIYFSVFKLDYEYFYLTLWKEKCSKNTVHSHFHLKYYYFMYPLIRHSLGFLTHFCLFIITVLVSLVFYEGNLENYFGSLFP